MKINKSLWDIEDKIRLLESKKILIKNLFPLLELYILKMMKDLKLKKK